MTLLCPYYRQKTVNLFYSCAVFCLITLLLVGELAHGARSSCALVLQTKSQSSQFELSYIGQEVSPKDVLDLIYLNLSEGDKEVFKKVASQTLSNTKVKLYDSKSFFDLKTRRLKIPFKNHKLEWSGRAIKSKEDLYSAVDHFFNYITARTFTSLKMRKLFSTTQNQYVQSHIDSQFDIALTKYLILESEGLSHSNKSTGNQNIFKKAMYRFSLLFGSNPMLSNIKNSSFDYHQTLNQHGPQTLYNSIRKDLSLSLAVKYWWGVVKNSYIIYLLATAAYLGPYIYDSVMFFDAYSYAAVDQVDVMLAQEFISNYGLELNEVIEAMSDEYSQAEADGDVSTIIIQDFITELEQQP